LTNTMTRKEAKFHPKQNQQNKTASQESKKQQPAKTNDLKAGAGAVAAGGAQGKKTNASKGKQNHGGGGSTVRELTHLRNMTAEDLINELCSGKLKLEKKPHKEKQKGGNQAADKANSTSVADKENLSQNQNQRQKNGEERERVMSKSIIDDLFQPKQELSKKPMRILHSQKHFD